MNNYLIDEISFAIANKLTSKLECSICKDLIINNLECIKCNTLFCEQCIINSIEIYNKSNDIDDEYKCPHCRCNTEFTENYFLTKLVREFTYNCKNCEESVFIKFKNEHSKQCKLLKKCLFCNHVYNSKHITCEYEQCGDCFSYYKRRLKVEHDDICPKNVLSCDFCGELFNREVILTHRKECEERVIACEACGQLGRYSLVIEHEKTCLLK